MLVLNFMNMNLLLVVITCFLIFGTGSATVLGKYINSASPCENYCEATFNVTFEESELIPACKKGCRLLTLIGLAKDEHSANKTETQCLSACQEAYESGPLMEACYSGCRKEASAPLRPDENAQTLHMLTPLMWVKSAYKSAAHNVRQMITTSFTFYLQEDSGKVVVLQTKPKTTVLDVPDYAPETKRADRDSTNTWQAERSDWMDCISQQSGLPRWILVSVLFGFIIALLWLCCVTTVTAPSHHLASAAKKLVPKNDIRYLCLYEPVDGYKIQPMNDVEAPPLPMKVNLPQ